MTSSVNNLDTLNGFFKEVYADRVEMLIPDGVKLYNDIKFNTREEQPGNFYHQPVTLGLEHGVTFGGPGDGAFNLNSAVAGITRDAQIRGHQLLLRSVISYSAASRATAKGKQAFESSTKYLVANMMRSMAKKLEIELFYGQIGYGKVLSVAGTVITMETAEWAPGIWAGAENMPIEIFTSAGVKRGGATVVSVSLSARTVTIDQEIVGVAVTDDIFHRGAFGNEFAGVHKILTNTGTLFGIDASAFNLWKGNEFSASSAPMSFAKIQKAVAKAIEKGLDDDVVIYINPSAWADLLNDQAALRQYDSSYSSEMVKNGAKAIEFYGQNGMIAIKPSIYVKEGFAYVLCLYEFSRVGSTDITFKLPGQNDKFFRELENSAGFELRAYTDQALFCYAPGKSVIIKDIVNS